MLHLKNLCFFVCIFLLLCSDFQCNPVESGNEDKDDKSESPEEEKSDEGRNKFDTATEKELLGKNAEEENIETPEQTELDTSTDSSEDTEEDIPEEVEQSLTDSEKARKPVHFLNVLFEKIEKELSDEKEENYEVKGEFDGKQKKEEVMKLLQEYYRIKGVSAFSRENFDKLWRQKQKKLGRKFPYIVENVISVLKDVKEDEEKPLEQQDTTISSEVRETSTEFSTPESSNSKEPDIINEAPKDTFAVWTSDSENICLLAKFQGIITIYYSTEKGEQDIKVPVPNVEKWKGSCTPPIISFASDKHDTVIFNMLLSKISEDSWAMTSIQLNYDTSNKLFDGALNRGKMTAMSKNLSLFETPIGRSYYCPGHETVLLYNEEKKQVATVKLSEIRLQPYQIEDNKFSEEYRCTQVILEGPDIFVVNETIPLAVGSTLALITLMILIGFSVHRAYRAAKPDYNSME